MSKNTKRDAKNLPGKPTKLPLTVGQVNRLQDKKGFITVVVPLSMDELGVGKDCLNDVVSGWITGGVETALEDISYRPVGVKRDCVLVEVTGNVKNWLAEQEDKQ